MKLDKVWLKDFKNLQDFSIDLDETSLTTVLVGRNGTGKSNLLEALIIIFRDLDLGAPPSLTYRLEYSCRGKAVKVDADRARDDEPVRVLIDGASVSYRRFTQREEPRYLPNYVFGYYSGPSNRMEAHFARHQEQFYRDLLRGVEKPLRPLFYARLVHSQFVLLAFFTEQDPAILKFLDKHLCIESLDSVLFVMKEPLWFNKKAGRTKRDRTFWNAKGVVRTFLENLYRLSLAPLRLEQRVQTQMRKSTILEHLYLYLKDVDQLRALSSMYSSQQAFFKALESTYISELIAEVRIRVKARNFDGSLTFREMSEGEQQLLMVLGLLRFTKEKESLFLLDEPDTHLNPAWSMRYIDFVREIVGDQETSHILMTTHDPLVLAGLEREQVQIMRRDLDSGRIVAELPEQSPRGMGVEAILTSELFGLRSTLDRATLHLLDRKRLLATKPELSPEEREELEGINEELRDLDFVNSSADPLYLLFTKAMTVAQAKEGLLEPTLTPEQWHRQRDLATGIVQELLAKRGAGV